MTRKKKGNGNSRRRKKNNSNASRKKKIGKRETHNKIVGNLENLVENHYFKTEKNKIVDACCEIDLIGYLDKQKGDADVYEVKSARVKNNMYLFKAFFQLQKAALHLTNKNGAIVRNAYVYRPNQVNLINRNINLGVDFELCSLFELNWNEDNRVYELGDINKKEVKIDSVGNQFIKRPHY